MSGSPRPGFRWTGLLPLLFAVEVAAAATSIQVATTAPQGELEASPAASEQSAGQSAGRPTWLPLQSFDLEGGIVLHVVERPLATTVAAGWAMMVGSSADPPSKGGLAHLVEHLLFQGSRTIGTEDWQRERELLELEERLREAGDERELAGVRRNLRRVQQPGELARLWAEGGFVGTGAVTTRDFAFYTASFPAERLEAWMWLESDRLLEPAMRNLEREIEVIGEEALERSGSSGRAELEAAFDADFWGNSAYGRSVDGAEGELQELTRTDALEFHRTQYRSDRLVLSVVGAVDAARVRALADRYFSRLSRSRSAAAAGSGAVESVDADPDGADPDPTAPAAPSASEGPPRAGGSGRCDCRPSARVRFATPAYGDEDALALDLLAALFNGRSGRLQREVVASQDVVFAAYASHKASRGAGQFSLVAEAADTEVGRKALERLRDRLLDQVERLRSEPASALEIQRARSLVLSAAAEEIKASDALRTRLLIDHALGLPGRLAELPARLQAIDASAVQSLVRRLLDPERAVAYYVLSEKDAR